MPQNKLELHITGTDHKAVAALRNFERIAGRSSNAVVRDGEKMRKAWAGLTGVVGGVTRGVFSLHGAIAGLGLGLLAKNTIDVASGFQKMQISLDTITKGRGEETFRKLNEWALKMPVNTEKAIESFTMLRAMGLDPTIKQMTLLADTTSALGGQADTMQGIARALGQMATKGKVVQQELNQLAERGVPIFEILREELNLTNEELGEIGKTGISAAEGIDAIWRGIEKRFAGQSERIMGTWGGMVEALFSYWKEFQRVLMDSGPFQVLENQLGILVAKIEEAKKTGDFEEWAQKSGRAIVNAMRAGVLAVRELRLAWVGIGGLADATVAVFTDAGAAILRGYAKVVEGFRELVSIGGLWNNAFARDVEEGRQKILDLADTLEALSRVNAKYAKQAERDWWGTYDAFTAIDQMLAEIGNAARWDQLVDQAEKYDEAIINGYHALQTFGETAEKTLGKIGKETEETAKTTVKSVEKAKTESEKIYENFLKGVQSNLADTFEGMFDDGVSSWADFFSSIGDMFRRLLAEMAAAAAMQTIVVPITTSLTGQGGLLGGLMGGQGGGMPNVPGGGSLLNKGWSALGSSIFSVSSIPGAGSAAASYVPGAVGGAGSGVGLGTPGGASAANAVPAWWGTLGSGLAAGGIAAMSYGPLAEATGMPVGKHSAALAGGLATIGMMAGGPIGAIAGGLIGGLFGSGSKTPVKRDLRLEISGDDANAFSWIRRAPSMGQTFIDWQEAGPPTGGGTMGDIGRQQWRARESGQEGFIDVQTGRFVTAENLDPNRQYFSENWTDKTRALEKQVNQWLDAAVKPIDTVIDTYEKYTDTVVNVPDFEMSAQVRGRNTNELIQDMLSKTEKELKAWTKDVTAAMGFETAEELTAYMAYLEQLAQQSGQQFLGGIRAALKADEGLDTWKVFSDTIEQSMYDSVLNGVINAFMESEMIKSALTPTMLAINEALDSAMSESGAFAADLFWNQVDPALDAMGAAIREMQPALDAIEGVSDKLTGKTTDNQVAEAGLKLMGVTGGVSQYLPTGYSGSGSPMPLSYWEEHGYQHGTGIEGLPKTGPIWAHKGEIILNPEESEAVRRGASGGRTEIKINIQAWDGYDVQRVVERDVVPTLIEVLDRRGGDRADLQRILDRG